MAIGTVSRFDRSSGYGFITPAAGGDQVFVRQAAIRGDGRLRAGDRVSYNVESTANGSQAIEVERLAQPAETETGMFARLLSLGRKRSPG